MNKDDLRKHILNANDLKREKLHIKEWDCDVWVQQLTGRQLDEWEQNRRDIEGNEIILGLRAKIVSFCLVDEEGNRLFDEKDIDKLSQKCGAALNKIIDCVSKLNRITTEDIEVMAKN